MTGATSKLPETTFWHPEGFDGLELEHTQNTSRPVVPQILGDYCLSFYLNGPATSRYQGTTHTLKDATFQSYQAGEVLAAAPQQGSLWSYQVVRISPELMQALAGATGHTLLPTIPVLSDRAAQRLGELFTDAFSGFAEGAPGLEREAKLATLTRALLKHQEQPRPLVTPRAEHAVETAKAYLRENLRTPTSLDQLAEHAAMSKFHLNKVFKRAVGVTPGVFQMSLRVREAKRLLRRRDPIAHVAIDLGFADQAHLTRTFKRYVGVTPGQYGAFKIEL